MANTFTVSIPAGPIWNDEDGQLKGPIVAAAHGGTFTGNWRTVIEGAMSTVDVEFDGSAGGYGADFTLSVPAGPIWDDEDAKQKAPVVAASYNATWTGEWNTNVAGEMSVIEVKFN